MSKFKVGDKVRIMIDFYTGCGLDAGTIHPIESIESNGYLRFKAVYESGMEDYLGFWPDQVELVDTNTLQVGQTYTSENGSEWECIFVRGDNAWMASLYGDGGLWTAYIFDIDGTNISQGGGSYNIKWGPKRETVKTRFSVGVSNKDALDGVDNHVANITFDLIDGTPDWTTAKVSPCD